MKSDATSGPTGGEAGAVYGNSWYAATMAERPAGEELTFDHDVDVCVVGGGLAGLTVAREVARRGWSVAVLEGRRIAWNASGRNAGFVLPGFAQPGHSIIARAGRDRAREMWRLSLDGLEYVRRTIAETGMPGVNPIDGWLQVSKVDRAEAIADEAAFLRDEFNADIETWPTELVRQKLRTPYYYQAIHYPTAFHIHPLNYALGLARAAEAAGARIFEQTPVLSIDAAGVRKRIVTPSARLRANHVVLAGNVHLGRVMPQISGTLVPISTYVIVTAPLGEKLNDALTYRGAVSDTERADNHYRVVDGDRLLWSGRVTTWDGDPKRYAKRLRADIARIYPQLGQVEIAYAWTGVLGSPVHRMPQIGEISSGLWLASGFGGHGLNTTAMAGQMIARGILDGDRSWRLFLPYELIWAGDKWGRAFVQAAYISRRVTDAAEARLSREREAARRRAREKAARRAENEAVRAAAEEARRQAEKAASAAAQAIESAPHMTAEADVPSIAQAQPAPAQESTKEPEKAASG